MKPMAMFLCAGVAVSVAGAGAARGQTINWAAATSGSWGTIGNWNPMNIPDSAGENPVLGLSGSYAATISGTTYSIGSLTISNPLAELRLDASDAAGFTTLAIHGDVSNNGAIRLTNQGTGNNARFQINANGLSLTGSGEIRMEETADADLYINVGGGGVFTNAAGHRITGAGTITGGGCTLTNNGTILGNLAGGMILANTITNNSMVRTTAPGSMTLSNSTINQSVTGIVEADNATFTLGGGTITGGTVRTVGGNGLISVSPGNGAISGIAALGNWEVPATDASGLTILYVRGSFSDNALIRLPAAGTGNNNRIQIDTNNVTIDGSGEIRMEEAADAEFYINVGGGGVFVNGPSHKITGAGTILGGGCTLTNNGTILANRSGGLTVSNSIANNNMMRAVSPGAMTITSVTVNQSGVIEADGAPVTLNGATINDNTVRGINGGVISVSTANGAIAGVTAEGNWEVPATDLSGLTILYVRGSITDNALIRLPAAGTSNNNRIQIDTNNVTIGGNGEIRMEEAADAEFYINVGGGGSFINGPAHKITGAGTILGGGCALTNNGTILADRAGGMAVANIIANNNLIRAVSPGSMSISSTVNQAGLIEADGTTITLTGGVLNGNTTRTVNGGVFSVNQSNGIINGITNQGNWEVPATDLSGLTILYVTGSFTDNGLIRLPAAGTGNNNRIQIDTNNVTIGGGGEIRLEDATDSEFYINVGGGGTFINGAGHKISGVGLITGGGCQLTNSGILAPGAPLGTLRVTNSVLLNPTSVVEIEVGGDAQAQRDYLDASGSSVTLGGTLKVRFRDGYVLPPCSSFVVVRGNLSGVFANLDLPVMPQGEISVSYGTNTVTIGYIPGDLNGDAILDFADYLQFLNLFDAGDIRADLNGDGIVDFSDYLDFLNLFDAGC